MLPAHHTGIANTGSNGHYFAPDAPVVNYNPQAPTVGVRVTNCCLKCSVASATLYICNRSTSGSFVGACHA
jgi:hypothetical protein